MKAEQSMIDTTQSRVSFRTPISVSKLRKGGGAKNPSLASQLPFPSSLPIRDMKARLSGPQRWRRGIGLVKGLGTMNGNGVYDCVRKA